MKAEALRKVAILLSTLDIDAADTILDHLPTDQASQIRQMLLVTESVPEEETTETVRAFLNAQIALNEIKSRNDSEPKRNRPPDFASQESATEAKILPPTTSESNRLGSHLTSADDSLLVKILRDELPQTIAIILSYVTPDRASQIVARLPFAKQAETLQRLVEADQNSSSIAPAVSDELESWLIEHLEAARQRAELVGRLSSMMETAPEEAKQQILSNLAKTDVELSRELGYAPTEEAPDSVVDGMLPSSDLQNDHDGDDPRFESDAIHVGSLEWDK